MRYFPIILLWLTFLEGSDLQGKELPIGLTAEEQLRLHEINEMGRSTDPPPIPIRNIAEYERMSGVLIRYPFGLSTDVIQEMAEDVIVYCLVSANLESSAYNTMNNAGVNMENVEFIVGNTDSYWTRDYGPWWVVDGDKNVSVVDFTYNRPRPNDNNAPLKLSDHLNTSYFATDVVHAGGNYMTDGYGISASTPLVLEENTNLNETELFDIFQSYYGINTYHLIADPTNTYIDHIDTWAKYVSPEKVMVREVPESHAQFEEIEAAADYFKNTTNAWGEPWEVVRIWTPNNQPYTNSLILNEKVFVPIMGSSWDDDAIDTYQNAMPGYEIIGMTGSWESTDALHCRTKGIPDLHMIQFFHNPLNDSTEAQDEGYLIETEIDALSDTGLIEDSIKVFYRTSGESSWNHVNMLGIDIPEMPHYRFAHIPALGTTETIEYYIQAGDYSGRVDQVPVGGYYEFVALPTDACADWNEGDMDHSGLLDVTDILLLIDLILLDESQGICSDSVADVNADGTLDVVDILMLVNWVMNPIIY